MLATWTRVPGNLLYLARRTTSLTAMVMGEVGAAVFPSLLMPRDRIAWESWAIGYQAGLPDTFVVPRATTAGGPAMSPAGAAR